MRDQLLTKLNKYLTNTDKQIELAENDPTERESRKCYLEGLKDGLTIVIYVLERRLYEK